MKRFFYSDLCRVFLTVLLLFSATAAGIYGFLTMRGYLVYGNVDTVYESDLYSDLFSKYVERTAVYVRYQEEGFELKSTDISPEMELLLEGELTDKTVSDELMDIFHPSDTSLYYYHNKLNVEPTNFFYYVKNTNTGTVYASPGFTDYAEEQSGSVEEYLTTGILKENIFAVLNSKNNRTLAKCGDSTLDRPSLLWSVDFLKMPFSVMAGSTTQHDPDRPFFYFDPTGNYELDILREEDPVSEPDEDSVESNYLVYAFVADSIVSDEFARLSADFASAKDDFKSGVPITTFFFCLTISLFLICNLLSGHHRNSNKITMRAQDKIFTEIFLALLIACILIPIVIYEYHGYRISTTIYEVLTEYTKYVNWVPLLILGVSLYLILVGFLYFSLIRRLKTGTFIKHSLIGKFLLAPLQRLLTKIGRTLKNFFLQLPSLWTAGLLIFVWIVWLIFAIFLLAEPDTMIFGVLMIAVEALFCILLFMHNVLDQNRIRHSTESMSVGDLSSRISTEFMLRSNKTLSEDINHICDGLNNAVNERTKSERMKTELITNVSHDIKTPLTSIINYIELLKNELPEDGVTAQYADILSQKSWRLKALIDDLVEASKVSSGIVHLDPICFNASELIRQAVGDFEERLQQQNLTLCMDLPEQPVNVLADGAATHRIIENMLSNVCKYALAGTRVFVSIDMPSETGLALLTIKNTSATVLSRTPEELMTRFTRDNAARTGEGSGLGLSIAESLASLQGGKFYIEIDGDLFKAKLTIPLAPETTPEGEGTTA